MVGDIENSIEEIIKQLELILKVRKEQKEIIECAGGSCINCDPDIKALSKSIEILSDYKRVLKENEELKNDYENLSNSVVVKNHYIKNSIPIQKVKDEIEKLNKKIDESIDNSKGGLDKVFIEEAGELLAQKRVLQELIKESEEK